MFTQSVRFTHRNLILAIRGAEGEKFSAPGEAIADYERALTIAPCNASLHRELVLLHAYQEATAMAIPDIDQAEAAAEATQSALGSVLACTPLDGKAWLDFAMLEIHRNGFTPRALDAYAMSKSVSPEESWLAKKRLLLALKFQPLFDEKAKAIARADLATLDHAHPIHMKAVVTAAPVKSREAVYALFAASAP